MGESNWLAWGGITMEGQLYQYRFWSLHVWSDDALASYYARPATHSLPKLDLDILAGALILGQMVVSLILTSIGAIGLPMRTEAWHRLLTTGLVTTSVAQSVHK